MWFVFAVGFFGGVLLDLFVCLFVFVGFVGIFARSVHVHLLAVEAADLRGAAVRFIPGCRAPVPRPHRRFGPGEGAALRGSRSRRIAVRGRGTGRGSGGRGRRGARGSVRGAGAGLSAGGRRFGAESGGARVGGRQRGVPWGLPRLGARVRLECGLRHDEAQGLGDGVEQEVSFADEGAGSAGLEAGEVQGGLAAGGRVGEQALHAEGVELVEAAGSPGSPRSAAAVPRRGGRTVLVGRALEPAGPASLAGVEGLCRLVAAAGGRLGGGGGGGRRRVGRRGLPAGLRLGWGGREAPPAAAVAVRAGRAVQGEAAGRVEVAALAFEELFLVFAFLLLHLLQLFAGDLLGVHGFPAARRGVRVVSRPPRAFLRVLFLSPFGPAVLEPDLHTEQREAVNTQRTSPEVARVEWGGRSAAQASPVHPSRCRQRPAPDV